MIESQARPNRTEVTWQTEFFNSNALIGGAQILVNVGAPFDSPVLDLRGHCTFMLIFTFNQAVGSNIDTWLMPVDPETNTVISGANIGNRLYPVAPNGTGADSLTAAYASGPVYIVQGDVTALVPILCVLRLFALGAAAATFKNVRLWCSPGS